MSKRHLSHHLSQLVLVGSIGVVSVLSACGPDATQTKPTTPTTPAGTAGSSSSAPTASGPASSPSASSSGSNATATKPPPSSSSGTKSEPMKAIVASSMETKLREIGLDPKALPPLNKLDYKTRNEVMNTFTKALGVQCGYCHLKDFKASTPNKKITAHMWNDFTRSLAMADGSALYCDSCHGGRTTVLDRKDLTALSTWMTENYVDKFKRTDKKEHTCETCHGDPIEGKIIAKLWKITPSP